jgi:hypothetical protein
MGERIVLKVGAIVSLRKPAEKQVFQVGRSAGVHEWWVRWSARKVNYSVVHHGDCSDHGWCGILAAYPVKVNVILQPPTRSVGLYSNHGRCKISRRCMVAGVARGFKYIYPNLIPNMQMAMRENGTAANQASSTRGR